MTTAGGGNGYGGSQSPLAMLRKIATRPPPAPRDETCDMCAEQIGPEHSHVVDIDSRQLMCACRGCYLLFTTPDAHQRYRAVPDRYLSFPDLALTVATWDSLQIPVGLSFFFQSSVLGRVVAFYPGPAGVAESELDLSSWDGVVTANPLLGSLTADVEALLVTAPDDRAAARCYLVPIDACYELAGRLRMVWRGFDGGTEAREQIQLFMDDVARRSRPARETDVASPSSGGRR